MRKLSLISAFLAMFVTLPLYAQDIGELPDNPYMRLNVPTEILVKALVANNIAYQGYRDTFHIDPRIDFIYVTKVSATAVRYKLIGKNFDAERLLGCVEWALTVDQSSHGSSTVYANRITKNDCSEYATWDQFMSISK